jgi:eukaryotic-like serine/threonine-protein kinase
LAAEPLDTELILSLGIEIADALDAAHAAGSIHLDISRPTFLLPSGDTRRFFDFGLAKLTPLVSSSAEPTAPTTVTMEEHLTSPGQAVGTVAYMSPEQVRAKKLDARTDLFSFGAVLYEMATGALAFRGESTGVIFKTILDATPACAMRLNPDLPVELERIIGKCLEKDRALRYQHASEIHTDLQRLGRDTPSGSTVRFDALAPVAPAKSQWLGIAVVLIAVLACAGIVVRAVWPVPLPHVVNTTQLTRDGISKYQLFTDGGRLYISEKSLRRVPRASLGFGRGYVGDNDSSTRRIWSVREE